MPRPTVSRAPSREPSMAQQGTPSSVSLDPMSRSRIDYAKHCLRAHAGTTATTSTIIRRALELYGGHVEDLTSALALRRDLDMERRSVLRAARGDTHSVPFEAIAAMGDKLPAPTLHNLLNPIAPMKLPPLAGPPWDEAPTYE